MSILAAYLATIGTSDITIDVNAGTYTNPIPGAVGSYSLQSDGTVATFGGSPSPGTWIIPAGFAPGAYEARVTVNSGALSSGTAGSWLALTSSRTWECAFNGTANLTVEIRDGSAVVQDSGVVVINGGGSP